ncbi:MAG: type II toxin-antitoxin system VapC family toxin [Symploca sp. SIO2E6]|nr:type II toxin-antitoxin system VapC family toxin [Symploca sp. SIO2E6]
MGTLTMTHILLDTHVLVWFVEGVDRLGLQSRQKIEQGICANDVKISAIRLRGRREERRLQGWREL